ncbi:unnamed protein product [Caenorhabditis angaria]|uniref:ER membrane protein complex subunit 7 beta-sandwich domain-containing protein n=1 Tax=Caenorhabditis angaria TaxID=860376 RepID=A0A9P1IKD7_9PELO|nr:unnamed protein product [Caenorhabditis angaria]
MKFVTVILLSIVVFCLADEETNVVEQTKFSVEGEIALPSSRKCASWSATSRILLNHGQYLGFVREDCTFRVDNVPSGTYIVQIENIDFVFEPIRVDITSKGKMRARKLSVMQPNNVNQLPYPLKLSVRGPARYFRKREEWRVTDMLFSPMVLLMAFPLIVMLIIPKMTANDPELKKEMEQMQLPKMDMPDVGEMMAKMFGGGNAAGGQPKKKSVTQSTSQRRK